MEETARRRNTDEFKEEAVGLFTSQGYRVSEVTRDFGIHVTHFDDGSRTKHLIQAIPLPAWFIYKQNSSS